VGANFARGAATGQRTPHQACPFEFDAADAALFTLPRCISVIFAANVFQTGDPCRATNQLSVKENRSVNSLKLRRILVWIHLYAAALLAPAFLLVAISGGLYLADIKGEAKETPLAIPAGTKFDSESPTFEADVRAFLKSQKLDVEFEYIRARGPNFTTRPTSRPHVAFEDKGGTLTAKYVEPSLLNALMEIHKGHGPKAYRLFGMIAGLMLFFVVIGGLLVGLLSPAYRKPTIFSAIAGSAVFGWLAFLA
jgi:hypothetical protein